MIRFAAVNRVNSRSYCRRFQKHHIIPLQAASLPEFQPVLGSMNAVGFCFDDFETNGILLPCDEETAIISGRPLHRGPHPRYNELVIDRLGLILGKADEIDGFQEKREFVGFRIRLLQGGLRRGLADFGFASLHLNKRDPFRSCGNFEHVDASVDRLLDSVNHPFR